MILVKTHGGLGNQLFQMFFALALSDKVQDKGITVFHHSRYKHRFELSPIFELYRTESSDIYSIISSMRMPKLLTKMGLISSGYLHLGTLYVLDDYFQNLEQYTCFTPKNLRSSMKAIKSLFSHEPCSKKDSLYHMRLKDFFRSEREEGDYLLERIKNIRDGSDIITNNDELFERLVDSAQLDQRNIHLIKTSDAKAEDILRLMTNYRTINSNGSTLAVWAALLSDINLTSSDGRLDSFIKVMKDATACQDYITPT
jgi:hypothetical protein